jgi:hypothetical protein
VGQLSHHKLSSDHVLTQLHYDDELETRSLPISAVSSTYLPLAKNISNSLISLPLNLKETPLLSPLPIQMESPKILDSELTPKWSSKKLGQPKHEVEDWNLDTNRQFVNLNNANDHAGFEPTGIKRETNNYSDISAGTLDERLLELNEEINALSEDNTDLERLLLAKSKECEDKGRIIADMWIDFERLEAENKALVSETERLKEEAQVRYHRIRFEKQRDVDLINQKTLEIEEQDNIIAVNQLRILELDLEIAALKGAVISLPPESNNMFSRYILPIIETVPPESLNHVKLLEDKLFEKDQIISAFKLKYDDLLNRSSHADIHNVEKRQNPRETDSELITQPNSIANANIDSFADIPLVQMTEVGDIVIMQPNSIANANIDSFADIPLVQMTEVGDIPMSHNCDARNTKVLEINADENKNSLEPVYSIFQDERRSSADLYLNQISILNTARTNNLITIDNLRMKIAELTSDDLIMNESLSKQYLIIEELQQNLEVKVNEIQ